MSLPVKLLRSCEERGDPMTQIGFYFDQTRCTGCYTCAIACKDWYSENGETIGLMRVGIIEEGKFPSLFVAYLASPCYHCADPPCATACPEDAIEKRGGDGIVVVHPDRCLGNKECPTVCLKACPWDAPQFGPEPGSKMRKCNLCLERLEQGQQAICVDACPMYALDAGPLEKLHAQYGIAEKAAGFRNSLRFRPSVTFKPKQQL